MRSKIDGFNGRLDELQRRWTSLIDLLPDEAFGQERYSTSGPGQLSASAALVIRSASVIEMVFGGLTTRLWDDPFEWTLPEAINSRERAHAYINEVGSTREYGMGFFKTDADLLRVTPSPVELRPVEMILSSAIGESELILEKALAIIRGHDAPNGETL